MMPFSVLISVYHKENPLYLKHALSSTLEQTVKPSEIVLVKDGPLTPALDDVVAAFEQQYPGLFKVLSLDQNMGLGHALNHGLEQCSYEVVMRMDSDDICYPERFEKQLHYIERKPDLAVLGAVIQEFNSEPGDLGQFRRLPTSYEKLQKFARYRSPVNHPAVALRKSLILKAGSYQHMPYFEDYCLWANVLSKGFRIENLDEPVLHCRVGNDMIGRRQGYAYFKNELQFLLAFKKTGFLNSGQFYFCMFCRLPLRLLPKPVLNLLYKKLLR